MKEIDTFYSNFRTTKFSKGDILLMQDVVPEYAYAIKTGSVRLYTLTSEYEERSVAFAVKNEVLPICWLFSKTQMTLFFYVAHTDCEVYVIPKQKFHEQLQQSAGLSYAMLSHIVNDYVAKSLQIRALEQSRANSKLLHTLNMFCLRHGARLTDELVRIPLPLTQGDIASFAGLTRETVALELGRLRKSDVLKVKNKMYTVNIVKLRQRMDNDQSELIKIAD